MNIIGRFFARIRQKLFVSRMDREIFFQIFPHLEHEADHGYQFSSDDELYKALLAGNLDAKKLLCDIDRVALNMPDAQGQAFRYIFARDLNQFMKKYMAYARRDERREIDPRFVATAA